MQPSNNRDIDTELQAWANSVPRPQVPSPVENGIQERLRASLTPVKPLPSPGRLALVLIAVFAAGAALAIAAMQYAGMHLMNGWREWYIAAALISAATLFASSLSWEMIPGTGRPFSLSFAGGVSALAIATVIALVFPWRSSAAFISEGWPCALLEISVAAPAAAIFWLISKRGVPPFSVSFGAALAGLSVLMAMIAVQFQCMYPQAPHVLIWHAGPAIVLIAAGGWIAAISR